MLLWRARDTKSLQENPLDSGAFLRVAAPFLNFLISMPFLLKKPRAISSLFSRPMLFLFLFTVFASLSSFYSKFPSYSLFKGWEYLSLVVWASTCCIISGQYLQGVLDTLLLMAALTIASSTFWALVSPSVSLVSMPGSIFGIQLSGYMPILNQNTLGTLGAGVSIMAFFRYLMGHRREYLNLLIGSLLVVFMAQSRTSLIMLCVALIFIIYLRRSFKLIFVLVVFAVIVYVFKNGSESIQAYFQRGQNLEKMESLSGRTYRWAAALEMARQSPFFGYGYASASRFNLQHYIKTGTGDTHSSWTEILIGLGGFGVILYLCVYLSTLIPLWARKRRGRKVEYESQLSNEGLVLLVAQFIRSLTSSGSAMLSADAFFLVVCVILATRLRLYSKSSLNKERTFKVCTQIRQI